MRSLLAIVLLIVAATSTCATELTAEQKVARARQVAEILEVTPLVDQLMTAPPANPEDAFQHMQVRVDALADLQRVSVMVDSTLARLQREQFEVSSARDLLGARQDDSVLRWNIAALLVGNGATIVGTSLQFDSETQAHIGDGIIIAGAAVATAFSIVALVRKSRGQPTYAIETNLLAQLLGRTPEPESKLPATLWRYLDTPLVGEHGSFRSQLVDRFVHEGSLSLQSTRAAAAKIDLLTQPIRRSQVVPADVLDLRAKMLDALRSRVAAMSIDLDLLIVQVRAHR